jgi:ubiquinone/menaquinone biosynthesis C-methylase UbiE
VSSSMRERMESGTGRREMYGRLARYYDLTHETQDYRAQADFVDAVFQEHGAGGKRVLDIACGTGEHARYLIGKRYDVTAIDLSAEMLAIARAKFTGSAASPLFVQKDVLALDFDGEFDAAYCLGSTFVYMTTHEMAIQALKGIWRSLKEGGVLVLDVLNGWQMLDTSPHVHVSQGERSKIVRFETRSIDKMKRVKHIESLWVIEENGRVSLDADRDEYRIFFPDELGFLIEIAGFETVAVYGDDLSSAFTPANYFATFVARKAMQAERAGDFYRNVKGELAHDQWRRTSARGYPSDK